MGNALAVDAAPLRSGSTRRLIFAALGLLQGLLIHAAGSAWADGWPDAAAQAVIVFAALAPPLWYLAYERARPVDGAVYAVGLAAIVALLYFWTETVNGLDSPRHSPIWVLSFGLSAAIGYISLPFFQCWQQGRDLQFPYPALFGHAWSNGLTLAAAAGFVVALWLLLWLWAALFQLVDIGFFSDLFSDALFAQPLTGLAFGLGVALLREHERLVQSLQSLAFALKMALAPVLPVAAVLFLLLLPFAGLETLWRTGHATTILLMVVAIGVFLANSVARDSGDERIATSAIAWPVMAHIAIMPIFTALAFYATGLRIAQHGLTPGRVYVVVLIFVAGLYAIVYSYAVFRRRATWDAAVRHYNPALAVIVAMVALILLTPASNAYRLSAWEQAGRLTSGKVDPVSFDFGYLRFELGAPGREALANLRDDPGAADKTEVRRRLALLETSKNYAQWKLALSRDQRLQAVEDFGLLHDYMVITPEAKAIPLGFEDHLRRNQPALLQWCHRDPIERCAIVIADLAGDGNTEAVIVRRWSRTHIQFEANRRDAKQIWRVYDRWTAPGGKADEIWQKVKAGAIEVVPPGHRALRIGDVTVPLAPRR